LVHEPTNKKEANTVVTLADGFTETTREGLPSYDLKIITDLYQVTQLRKGNNRRTRYAFIDDKLQFLATFNSDGEVVGRSGKFFTDGIDAKGYDKATGETMIAIQAENAFETFDLPAVIQLSKDPSFLFKSLLDIYLYEKATATAISAVGGTAATRTVTITAIGSNGDTIDVLDDNGDSISQGPCNKTSSESTAALLATKLALAITLGTTGYSAAAVGAVITITATAALGATVNTIDTAPVVTGGITTTHTAFTGGVTAIAAGTKLKLSGKTPSPLATVVLDFYEDYGASALGTDESLYSVKKSDGTVMTVSAVAPNAAGYFDVDTNITVAGNYIISTVTPDALDTALVKGIEINSFVFVKS
jgi:hypothetical protein